MSNTAALATGSLLKVGSGSPITYTAIANISSFSGPSLSANLIDVPVHNSVNGYVDRIQGLRSAGEVTAELYFDPNATTHQQLVDLYNDGTIAPWKIEISDTSPAATFSFSGIVSGLDFDFPVDGARTCSLTISISGEAVLN